MDSPVSLAIIGGSGLYTMPGLEAAQTLEVDTPFGKPSAPIVVGDLEGVRVAFLARHGIGHTLMPSQVPYRANIYALKALGAGRVVSISACGSLREDYAPGDIVIPDQIFDFTHKRERSFFGDGLVAHVSVADPFCPDLSEKLFRAVQAAAANTPLGGAQTPLGGAQTPLGGAQTPLGGAQTHRGGASITIEGPRFSTKAESQTYRAWGMSIIGMTASPEVFLAREAELCYATMAHVTDYDVWHVSESPVTVEMVIQTLHRNTQTAQEAIRILIKNGFGPSACGCPQALASALITHPGATPPATRQKLDLLVGKYLK